MYRFTRRIREGQLVLIGMEQNSTKSHRDRNLGGNCRDKDWRELAISETGFTRVILKDVGSAFIRLSIYSGCVLYATEKVTSQDALTKADRSASLLDVILHFFQSPDENKVNHITAIRRLLPLVDLNLSEFNWSVWSQLLHYASMWNRKQQKGPT